MAQTPRISRRGFLATLSATAGGAALTACTTAPSSNTLAHNAETKDQPLKAHLKDALVTFDGPHQAGISTPAQAHLNLVAFNLADGVDRAGLTRLMRSWTEDSRRLCLGQAPLGSLEPELAASPANLSITCGFGPRIFDLIDAPEKRPHWLAPLKKFNRDQLDPAWGQTDLVIQICADDPLTLSHAMRHLVRSGVDYATVAWVQQGFLHANGSLAPNDTPRNLFGQVDGTVNPRGDNELANQVWIGDTEPAWAHNSTSMIVRRIRMNMDTWEMLDRRSREESLGRNLHNGAPLSGEEEFDTPDMDATDTYGLPVIDQTSHMARAMPAKGHPEQRMLRRPYNYDLAPEPGSDQLSNSGMVFITFQQDPLTQYVPVQERLDEADRLNEWISHIGSAVYWIPPGVSTDGQEPDKFWAQSLLEDSAGT